MIVILTLLYCDTRKYEFDIRKIIITNWTDLVKKLESLSFFFFFFLSQVIRILEDLIIMQIKWRSAIERKNIETILYGTTLGNSKMDQWIHLVFSTARTNSSFHSFFFQLVNFYDIFLLRQLAWDKKRITSSKNLYKFHRSWSLQRRKNARFKTITDKGNNHGVK